MQNMNIFIAFQIFLWTDSSVESLENENRITVKDLKS